MSWPGVTGRIAGESAPGNVARLVNVFGFVQHDKQQRPGCRAGDGAAGVNGLRVRVRQRTEIVR